MQTKKNRKTKDKCSAEKTLATLQRNNKKKIQPLVLYLWPEGIVRFKSPDWPLMGKSLTWSLSKIRPSGFKITVRKMQPISRGHGSRVLRKNVKGNRRGKNGTVTKR